MIKRNTIKRVTAGLLALALVAGTMPANVGGFLTGGTAIVASADTQNAPYVVGTTLHLAGSGWTMSTMWGAAGVDTYWDYPKSQNSTITKIVADQGTVLPTNCSIFAIAFTALTEIDLTNADASEVTNMNSMFATGGPLQGSVSSSSGGIDTKLTSIKFGSNFNTAKVTDMNYMFQKRAGLTSLDLSCFNTSEVTSMNAMFNNCTGLTTVDLSSFNTSKVTNMRNMFKNCTGLTTVTVGSGWNTDAVTSYNSSSMFTSCNNIKGKNGTTYDSKKTDKEYAHIDGFGGKGYFCGEAVTYTLVSAKAATCTENGNYEYYTGSDEKYYTKNGNTYTETTLEAVTIPATGHSYGEPVWQWAEDHSTAKATFTCANDVSHTVEVNADISVETTDPTYAADGQTKYTATVTFNNHTYTDVQTETLLLPTIATGQCGELVNYKLFEDGTLYVYGTGATYNYYRNSPFTNNNNITNIIVAEGVTDIGNCLFYNTNASTVSLPGSLRTIGDKAFQLSENFTTIAIPEGVTSIGEESFATMNLTSISLPNTLTTIGNGAFYRSVYLEEIIIPNSVTTIGDTLFSGCISLSSVTLSNNITAIPDYTFYQCESLTSVEIPSTVTSIGNRAFSDCKGLTDITIPANVIELGESVFDQCTSLSHIRFDNSEVLHNIGETPSLTSITFGENVTQIGIEDEPIFYDFENIETICCFADPENLTWYNYYSGFKSDGSTICYVPSEYLDSYNAIFGDEVYVTYAAFIDISKAEITFENGDTLTANNNDQTIKYTVKVDNEELTRGVDYEMSEGDETASEPGTYVIKLRAKADRFTGEKVFGWYIVSEPVTVRVNEEVVSGVEYGKSLTVKAPAAPENHVFSHWSVNNEPVSYSATYSFIVKESVDLVPIYVLNTETVEKQAVLTLKTAKTTYNGKNAIQYQFTHSIPEGYTVQEVGLLYATNKLAGADTTKAGYATVNLVDDKTFGVDDVESVVKSQGGKVKKYVASYKKLNGTVTFSYAIGTNTNAYTYAVGYVKVNKPDGTSEILFTNFVSTSYNNINS